MVTSYTNIDELWNDISEELVYSELLGIESKYQYVFSYFTKIFDDQDNWHIHYVMPHIVFVSQNTEMLFSSEMITKKLMVYYFRINDFPFNDVIFCDLKMFKS
jgi:hypothetical protein